MTKLIHPELTYTIRGIFFDVYNQLGPSLPEHFYQEAIMIGLAEKGIQAEKEKPFTVYYEGAQVGQYFVDVWIETGKLLLELKVTPEISPLHRAQALSYLKITDADLAIVANFGSGSMKDERLPNFLRNKTSTFTWTPQPIAIETQCAELTNDVLQAAYRVHFVLGCGYLHQIYRRATMVELHRQTIGFEYIKEMPIQYHGNHLGNQPTRLIVVGQKLLLATFAFSQISEAHKNTLRARMKQIGVTIGLLVNFGQLELETALVKL